MVAEVPPNRLRELRQARGLKSYDISAMVRRDTSTVLAYERGEVTIPDEIKLQLAEFYGVTAAYLMGWPEQAPKADKSKARA